MRIALHAHNMQVVLNADLVPRHPAEATAWTQTQAWAFMVLMDIIMTFHGKAILNKFRAELNATKALCALNAHYQVSTAKKITAQRILSYLLTFL